MENSKSNPLVSYEVVDGRDECVAAYSLELKENSNGRFDPLKMAQDTLKFRQDYKLYEVYKNGFRKEI